VPKELKDVLGLLASEFGGFAESFSGGVVRFYLRELAEAPALAKQIVYLARSTEAEGTSGGRLAFRAERTVVDEAWRIAKGAKAKDKSEMIRGLIVLAKHDAYGKIHERRRSAMRAIAHAVSE
jgi:DNA-binding protein YbaB